MMDYDDDYETDADLKRWWGEQRNWEEWMRERTAQLRRSRDVATPADD